MGKKSKIYTKTGDDGTTGLVGGNRVKKYDTRLEAYGTVDELNANIGFLASFEIPADVRSVLFEIQNKLFNIGSRLASDEKGDEFTAELSVTENDIRYIEKNIDRFEHDLPELTQFILPGGSTVASSCHIARTVCRRAERRILTFAENNKVEWEILKFINRLSDLLFVLARKLNKEDGREEMTWER